MVKAILLINVSLAGSGLDPRLDAIHQAKVIQQILRHPAIRGFSTQATRTLKNPTQRDVADAIEQLFDEQDRQQLLILVFLGQGVRENSGKYGSTCGTPDNTGRQTNRPFVFSAAIAIGVIHNLIDQCLAQQQAITLDNCYDSDAKGGKTRDKGIVDVRAQLEGDGWIIITSSTPSASQLHPNIDNPPEPDRVSRLWRRPTLILAACAAVMVTLAFGSSYALLQSTENQQAKHALEKAQVMQARADYAGCVTAARLIPTNASTYLTAQNVLKTCEVGQVISTLISQKDYQGCIEQAQSIPPLKKLLHTCRSEQEKSARLDQDKHLWDKAQQLAVSHNLKDAVTYLSQISQPSLVHPEAQTLINLWSTQLLEQAANAYGEGQYDNAIALAQAIPTSSLSYQQAQKTLDQWQKEWASNMRQLEAAQHALEVGIWHEAVSAAETIDPTSSYWRQQASDIIAQADEHLLAEAQNEAEKKRCRQYQTDYQQGVIDAMAAVGPKGGAIREKCADLGIVIAEAY